MQLAINTKDVRFPFNWIAYKNKNYSDSDDYRKKREISYTKYTQTYIHIRHLTNYPIPKLYRADYEIGSKRHREYTVCIYRVHQKARDYNMIHRNNTEQHTWYRKIYTQRTCVQLETKSIRQFFK